MPARSPVLPEVPTLDEAGLRGFEATAWFGILAPAGTPRAVIETLGRAVDATARDAEFRARMEVLGAELPALTADGGSSPAAFEAFLAACNPDAGGVDPAVTPPVTVPAAPGSTTPAVANAVSVTPAGGGTPAVATNKGLNVQTSAQAEPGVHPGLALLAGLLAAGIAVPAAVAMRMRRLERTRK